MNVNGCVCVCVRCAHLKARYVLRPIISLPFGLMNSNEHFSHIIFHKHLTFECLTNTPSNMTAEKVGTKRTTQQTTTSWRMSKTYTSQSRFARTRTYRAISLSSSLFFFFVNFALHFVVVSCHP